MKLSYVNNWSRRFCFKWLATYDYPIPKKGERTTKIRGAIQEIIEIDLPYLLEDKFFTPVAKAERAAVILLMKVTNGELILLANPKASVYLVPAIMPGNMVEYQVSDGMPGVRSSTYDFWDLTEAINCFNLVVEKGWDV